MVECVIVPSFESIPVEELDYKCSEEARNWLSGTLPSCYCDPVLETSPFRKLSSGWDKGDRNPQQSDVAASRLPGTHNDQDVSCEFLDTLGNRFSFKDTPSNERKQSQRGYEQASEESKWVEVLH